MKTQVNYTTINHVARERLQLSWLEYGLCDLIYNLSNNPASTVPGWSYASRETYAKRLGVSKRAVFDMIDRLLVKKLIERDPTTKYLRVTIDWYNTVVIRTDDDPESTGEETSPPMQNSTSKSGEETASPMKKLHSTDEETSPVSDEETSPNIYRDTIDTTHPLKDDGDVFIEKFNKLFNSKYQLTTGRKDKLKTRLKTFSIQEILRAIQTLSESAWHQGQNERGWKADPDFILRNDEQIDKWLNKNPLPAEGEVRRPAVDEVPPEHWARIRELEDLEKLKNGQKT